jgi:hypothetical protein
MLWQIFRCATVRAWAFLMDGELKESESSQAEANEFVLCSEPCESAGLLAAQNH